MATSNNPSAFPSQQEETLSGTWNQSYDPGMTLRDYFAGQALAGYVASNPADYVINAKDAAEVAYQCANAMLAERDRLTKEERGENAAH